MLIAGHALMIAEARRTSYQALIETFPSALFSFIGLLSIREAGCKPLLHSVLKQLYKLKYLSAAVVTEGRLQLTQTLATVCKPGGIVKAHEDTAVEIAIVALFKFLCNIETFSLNTELINSKVLPRKDVEKLQEIKSTCPNTRSAVYLMCYYVIIQSNTGTVDSLHFGNKPTVTADAEAITIAHVFLSIWALVRFRGGDIGNADIYEGFHSSVAVLESELGSKRALLLGLPPFGYDEQRTTKSAGIVNQVEPVPKSAAKQRKGSVMDDEEDSESSKEEDSAREMDDEIRDGGAGAEDVEDVEDVETQDPNYHPNTQLVVDVAVADIKERRSRRNMTNEKR